MTKLLNNFWFGATCYWMLFVFVGIPLLGCEMDTRNEYQRAADDISDYLPPGAQNVVPLEDESNDNGDWATYELEIDGKRYKFLYHHLGTVMESNTLIGEVK